MDKIKRLIALIGVIVLIGLYVLALIFAFMDNEASADWLKAAIFATIVLPVLLWAYSFIYRLLRDNYGPGKSDQDSKKNSDKKIEK